MDISIWYTGVSVINIVVPIAIGVVSTSPINVAAGIFESNRIIKSVRVPIGANHGLVIEGHGEIAAFVDLFTAVERSQPALFIDNLILRRYQSPNGPQPGSRLPLSARFEIHAPHQLGVDG